MPRARRLEKGSLRRLWIADEHWDVLRIAAVKRRTNVTVLVNKAVVDWLRRNEGFEGLGIEDSTADTDGAAALPASAGSGP